MNLIKLQKPSKKKNLFYRPPGTGKSTLTINYLDLIGFV